MADILILGGGFGGLETSNRLRSALGDAHNITVIDRRDRFTIGAAKLWHIAGLRSLDDSTRPLSALRERGIDYIEADIDGIEPDTRTVRTSAGSHRADFLVIALGASFFPAHVEELRPPAYNLYDPGSVRDIRAALEPLDEGRIAVTIMGLPYKCPPAPYEAAFLIDQYLREQGRRDRVELEVYTVQPSPLPVAGPEASRRVAETLGSRGIALYSEHEPARIDSEGHEIHFANGHRAGFDLLLGVPKHVAPKVVAESRLAGPKGWITTDPSTLLTEFERVYAIGDCTSIPNAVGEIPKAGVFAEAQGRVVADRIIADIGDGDGPTFDGLGYCFLEFAGGEAAKIEGDFLAEPRPDVSLVGPNAAIFRDKETFVSERLDAWL
ncbi:MAG: NAD(P)/FAD-dependent oxidoreductase [Actinobacteria bacterium]|nr:NAD(P)/FAD-dependent oxidoreductase [Actinomycetota bacterium]